jgi:D-alanyl-lipoteichoic acid acyltransferase DltB (MBOAT superfamily)
MLFNSFQYFLIFLPASVALYYSTLYFLGQLPSKVILITASLFFYGFWNYTYLPLLITSIIVNYAIGIILLKNQTKNSNNILYFIFGIAFNLCLLAYFKYTAFILENINSLANSNIKIPEITLPLAISFFTFQQIIYLVDTYKGATKERNFINYSLFVSFFPQLIAGPIVRHRQIIPQFMSKINARVCMGSIKSGIGIFILGLFKKIVIADSFGNWAEIGFQNAYTLNILEAWMAAISFSLQIYFDFSGYVDMAVGSALLLNIRLPINFDSPYSALNIREFWRKWHITLGNFFRENVYIPLGGNKKGTLIECRNLLFTFGLVGLWHGANWTFVVWGAVHGIAVVFNLLWRKLNWEVHKVVAWFLTFLFVCVSWVFFKSSNLSIAIEMIFNMVNFSELSVMTWEVFNKSEKLVFSLIVIPSILLSVIGKNTNHFMDKFDFNHKNITMLFLAVISLVLFSIGGNAPESFIYSAF